MFMVGKKNRLDLSDLKVSGQWKKSGGGAPVQKGFDVNTRRGGASKHQVETKTKENDEDEAE